MNYFTLIAIKNVEGFVHEVNKARKGSNNQWYSANCMMQGKQIQIKGFGTWLQTLRVSGIDYSTTMELSVESYKELLSNTYKEAFK